MGADDQQNSVQPDRSNSIDHMWQKIKTAYTETALKVLGRRKKKCKNLISTESFRKIEETEKEDRRCTIGEVEEQSTKRVQRKGQGGEEEPQEGQKRQNG